MRALRAPADRVALMQEHKKTEASVEVARKKFSEAEKDEARVIKKVLQAGLQVAVSHRRVSASQREVASESPAGSPKVSRQSTDISLNPPAAPAAPTPAPAPAASDAGAAVTANSEPAPASGSPESPESKPGSPGVPEGGQLTDVEVDWYTCRGAHSCVQKGKLLSKASKKTAAADSLHEALLVAEDIEAKLLQRVRAFRIIT